MHRILIYLLVLVLFPVYLVGQVSIGSSLAPSSGALLDLKQDDGILKNSDKGLGMPRVKLTKGNTIDMGGNVIDPSLYNSHTGLLVYNMTQLDGAQITDVNEKLCIGLNVWNGEKWEQLVGSNNSLYCAPSLELVNGQLSYFVASGQDLRTIAPIQFGLKWQPATASVSLSQSILAGLPMLSFNPAASAPTGGGGASINLTAVPMTEAEVKANPFATKAVKLNYKLADGDKDYQKVEVEVRQTNFALTLNGKTDDILVRKISDATAASPYEIPLKGNVEWNAVSADTEVTPVVATGGEYTHTGVGNASVLKLQLDHSKIKTAHDISLTLKDKDATIKKNIKYTMSQCRGGAIDYENDKPEGLGILTDHEGNKYWTRDFGPGIGTWMLQNLRTKTHDPVRTGVLAGQGVNEYREGVYGSGGNLKPIEPTHGFNNPPGEDWTLGKYWVYPQDPTATGNVENAEMSPEMFEEHSELGLLYSYLAATGIRSESGQKPQYDIKAEEHNNVQGICPAGWRLPNTVEVAKLMQEINKNTDKYTTAAAPLNIATTSWADAEYERSEFFQDPTDITAQHNLYSAMIDVCNEKNPESFSDSSLKHLAGIGLEGPNYVNKGIYVPGIHLWIKSDWSQLGYIYLAQEFVFYKDSSTNKYTIKDEKNNEIELYNMGTVRCVKAD